LARRRELQEKKLLYSRRIFTISEYELSNGTLKFFVEKGVIKKKRVLIREIPVNQITNIGSIDNELSVTWNGVTNLFFMNDRLVTLSFLRDKVINMLEEPSKTLPITEETVPPSSSLPVPEPNLPITEDTILSSPSLPVPEPTSTLNEETILQWTILQEPDSKQKLIPDSQTVFLRKSELLGIINASIGIIDFAYNILIGLHKTIINWGELKDYSSRDFQETFSFTGQSMPPMNVDFLKISSAIRLQVSEEASSESYKIIGAIKSYFGSLSLDDDFEQSVPNFRSARAIIFSYYKLNNILLGKVIGEKVNYKEKRELENVLEILANSINFRVNIDGLKESVDKEIQENYLESYVEANRKIFKEQFLLLVKKSFDKNEDL
jgi:hypothetical protein